MSRAAEVLNVAQSALSLHVRNMEARLETPLLLRTPRGVEPTESGQILLRHARIILDQIVVAEEEIRGAHGDPAGDVRLGLPGTIAQVIAVPLIRRVRDRHPRIRLRLAEAMSGYVQEWLAEGSIELAILYGDLPDPHIATRHVLDEVLMLCGPPSLAAQDALPPGGSPLPLARALDLPLILPAETHSLRRLLAARATALGRGLQTLFDVDSFVNIKALAAEGLGYSILPQGAIAAEVAEGRLSAWPFADPPLTRSVHLAHVTDRPQTHAVAAVQRLTDEVLRDLVRSGQWIGARLVEEG